MPLVTLLGGRESETVELYKVLTQGTVESMTESAIRIVSEGFNTVFRSKSAVISARTSNALPPSRDQFRKER